MPITAFDDPGEDASLLIAARVLEARGIYGVAWLTPDLVVTARYGRLVHFIAVGRPVGESVLALFGQEERIRALVDQPDDSVDLANVSIRCSDGGTTPKVDLGVLWLPTHRRYLLLVGRVLTRAIVEELGREQRRRLMAEAELARRNDELSRANRDLDEYASIISHDLNAPLRAMRFLADDAEAALAGGDVAAAREVMATLREQSRRMAGMVSGLLDYARVGGKEEALARVDTRRLAEAVATTHRARPGFSIEVAGDWPTCETLAAPLDMVLRNLADNAVKHHDRREGKVVLTCRAEPGWLRISVTDDGPGIETAHQAAIFKPFVRLHPERSEDGRGIGLSVVRRTIESVGGKIAVRSDPARSRGTEFEVVWPVTNPVLPGGAKHSA